VKQEGATPGGLGVLFECNSSACLEVKINGIVLEAGRKLSKQLNAEKEILFGIMEEDYRFPVGSITFKRIGEEDGRRRRRRFVFDKIKQMQGEGSASSVAQVNALQEDNSACEEVAKGEVRERRLEMIFIYNNKLDRKKKGRRYGPMLLEEDLEMNELHDNSDGFLYPRRSIIKASWCRVNNSRRYVGMNEEGGIEDKYDSTEEVGSRSATRRRRTINGYDKHSHSITGVCWETMVLVCA